MGWFSKKEEVKKQEKKVEKKYYHFNPNDKIEIRTPDEVITFSDMSFTAELNCGGTLIYKLIVPYFNLDFIKYIFNDLKLFINDEYIGYFHYYMEDLYITSDGDVGFDSDLYLMSETHKVNFIVKLYMNKESKATKFKRIKASLDGISKEDIKEYLKTLK